MTYDIIIYEVIFLKVTKYIKDSVLIRDFNKGKSSQLFNQVKKSKLPMKVTKNGKDYVVIMDYDKYIEIADFIEKYNEGTLNI